MSSQPRGWRRTFVVAFGVGCLVAGGVNARSARAGGAGKDFTFTLRSEMDPLTAGGTTFVYATVFHVDGASGRAELSISRHQANQPHPVGLFGEKLETDRIEALSKALSQVDWKGLPAGVGGDPSAATLTLEYTRGGERFRYVFNARNANVLEPLQRAMAQIDQVETQLLKKPRRALALSVSRSHGAFKVSWKNVGTGPVTIADPRGAVTGGAASTRGFVKVWLVAPTRPGFDPPNPTPVTLPLAPASGGEKPLTIAAGATFEAVTAPFSDRSPGDQIVQAGWIDYEGPSQATGAAAPAIAVSLQAQVDDKRPYVLRGAVFSPNIKVAPGER